jgi:hypothetical protein
MTYHALSLNYVKPRPACIITTTTAWLWLFRSGFRIAVFCTIAILVLGGRTFAQDSTGEVDVVGTVEGGETGEVEVVGTVATVEGGETGEVEVVGTVATVEGGETGEVEVVGTVTAVEDGGTGEVEVVGTIALPQTLVQVSSWGQIKLLRRVTSDTQ